MAVCRPDAPKETLPLGPSGPHGASNEHVNRERPYCHAVQRWKKGWRLVRAGVLDVVARGDVRHRDRAIKARQHGGVRGQVHLLALARGNENGASREANAHAASEVAGDQPDGRASTAAEGQTQSVTFVVVLLLDNLAFGDFDVVADRTRAGIDAWLTNRDKTHVHGNQAAVDLDGLEGQVQVSLAFECGEKFGFLDYTDDPVQTGACGKDDAAVKSYRLGEDGHKRITFSRLGGANRRQESEMDFGALRELARLGKRGPRSRTHQRGGENGRDCDFHENPPACTSVQVIPVTWGGGLRSETRRWRADLASAAGRGKVVGEEELQPDFSLLHQFRRVSTASGRVPCLATHDNGVKRGTETQPDSPAGTIVLTTPSGRVTSMNWLRGKRYAKLYLVVGES